MRLVHEPQRVVPPLERHDLRQRCEIAAYAVDALDRNQRPPRLRPLARQERRERPGIVVRKREPARAREPRAGHDAVVRQAVVHHEVARSEQVPDHRHIRRISADQGQRVAATEKGRELAFQFAMQRSFTRRHATRRGRGAVTLDRRHHGAIHGRIAREPEIVLGGKID